MAVVVIIFLMVKFWPITLLLIGLIIWLCSTSSSSSGSYSSDYYPSCSSHHYEDDCDDEYPSYSNVNQKTSSSYDDYYDFGPDVNSDKMYEHAARLAEEDPEAYAELEMGDWLL